MRDTVSGAIAIPRQAGDVPQPCRTGFGWYSKGNVSCETVLLGKRTACGSILTAVYSEICGKSVIFISTNAIKIVVSVSSKLPLALQSAFKVAAADNVICPARYLFRKIASEISTTPSKLTSPQFLGYSYVVSVVVSVESLVTGAVVVTGFVTVVSAGFAVVVAGFAVVVAGFVVVVAGFVVVVVSVVVRIVVVTVVV